MAIPAAVATAFVVYGAANTLIHNIIEIRSILQECGDLDSNVNNEVCNLRTLQRVATRLGDLGDELDDYPEAKGALDRTNAKIQVIEAKVKEFGLASSKSRKILRTFLKGQLKRIGELCKNIGPLQTHLEGLGVTISGLLSVRQRMEHEHSKTRIQMSNQIRLLEGRQNEQSDHKHSEMLTRFQEYHLTITELLHSHEETRRQTISDADHERREEVIGLRRELRQMIEERHITGNRPLRRGQVPTTS